MNLQYKEMNLRVKRNILSNSKIGTDQGAKYACEKIY